LIGFIFISLAFVADGFFDGLLKAGGRLIFSTPKGDFGILVFLFGFKDFAWLFRISFSLGIVHTDENCAFSNNWKRKESRDFNSAL
jgi:hypothetical protein